MEEIEVWKVIPDSFELYEASSLGRIRRKSTKRILKPSNGRYAMVVFSFGSRTQRHDYNVHSLVAKAFLGQRPKDKCVDHIDGNKLNNRVDNLEYVSESENHTRAIIKGQQPSGEDHPNAKLANANIHEIKELHRGGASCQRLGILFGVSHTTIRSIVKGRSWKYV